MSQNNNAHTQASEKEFFNPNEHLIDIGYGDKKQKYLEVKWRLAWFVDQCPKGTIETEMVFIDLDRPTQEEISVWNNEKRRKETVIKEANGFVIFRATITDGSGRKAIATKSEKAAAFPDYIEKCESGAIGRALAMLGFGTQFTGDEFKEHHRLVDSPVDMPEQPAQNTTTSSGAASTLPSNQTPEASMPEGITAQQIASIEKVSDHLGKTVPDNLKKMTFLEAKTLIQTLTAEYRQAKVSNQPANVVMQQHAAPVSKSDAARVEKSPATPATPATTVIPTSPSSYKMSQQNWNALTMARQALRLVPGEIEAFSEKYIDDIFPSDPAQWTDDHARAFFSHVSDWKKTGQREWRQKLTETFNAMIKKIDLISLTAMKELRDRIAEKGKKIDDLTLLELALLVHELQKAQFGAYLSMTIDREQQLIRGEPWHVHEFLYLFYPSKVTQEQLKGEQKQQAYLKRLAQVFNTTETLISLDKTFVELHNAALLDLGFHEQKLKQAIRVK